MFLISLAGLVGQGACGFDQGRSLIDLLNVKSLATPCVAK